jgi:hypothetical protein
MNAILSVVLESYFAQMSATFYLTLPVPNDLSFKRRTSIYVYAKGSRKNVAAPQGSKYRSALASPKDVASILCSFHPVFRMTLPPAGF